MKQLTVTIFINPAQAARSGRATCGDHALVLSDADLASLTPAQREGLALHLEGKPDWNVAWYGREVTVAELGRLIDERHAENEQRENVQKANHAKAEAEEAARRAEFEAELEVMRTCPVGDLLNSYGVKKLHRFEPWARLAGREAEVDAEIARRKSETEASQKAVVLGFIRAACPEHEAQFLAGLLPEGILTQARETVLAAKFGVGANTLTLGRIPLKSFDPRFYPRFREVTEIASKLTGATVEVHGSYRLAKDDEEGDRDGEVLDDDLPAACVSAMIGGAETVAHVPLF